MINEVCRSPRGDFERWQDRSLEAPQMMYLFLDGTYLKLRPEDRRAIAVLCATSATNRNGSGQHLGRPGSRAPGSLRINENPNLPNGGYATSFLQENPGLTPAGVEPPAAQSGARPPYSKESRFG